MQGANYCTYHCSTTELSGATVIYSQTEVECTCSVYAVPCSVHCRYTAAYTACTLQLLSLTGMDTLHIHCRLQCTLCLHYSHLFHFSKYRKMYDGMTMPLGKKNMIVKKLQVKASALESADRGLQHDIQSVSRSGAHLSTEFQTFKTQTESRLGELEVSRSRHSDLRIVFPH